MTELQLIKDSLESVSECLRLICARLVEIEKAMGLAPGEERPYTKEEAMNAILEEEEETDATVYQFGGKTSELSP